MFVVCTVAGSTHDWSTLIVRGFFGLYGRPTSVPCHDRRLRQGPGSSFFIARFNTRPLGGLRDFLPQLAGRQCLGLCHSWVAPQARLAFWLAGPSAHSHATAGWHTG